MKGKDRRKRQVSHEATEYKTAPSFARVLETKDADVDEGIVEHYISIFGVLDLGRDITHPGSFSKTIQERAGSIRVLDSHGCWSCLDVVGRPLKIEEVSRDGLPQRVLDKYPEATGGVKCLTQFLLDTPEGLGIFNRIKGQAVDEFSFAYDTIQSDESMVTRNEKDISVRNLREIRLYEYSPVVFGMNPATTVVAAKDPSGGTDEEEDPDELTPDVEETTDAPFLKEAQSIVQAIEIEQALIEIEQISS